MSYCVSESELRRMVDLVQPTAGDPEPGQSFDHGLLSRLAAAFDCEAVTFQESEPVAETFHCLVDGLPDGSFELEALSHGEEEDRAYWRAHWEDQSCCYPERSGDHVSVTLHQDFQSGARSRDSAWDGLGCLMVPLPWVGSRDRRLSFWRGQGELFGESDRLVLTLLRPHLAKVLDGHDRARRGLPPLTPRERELVILLAGGLSNRQISRKLGIAEGTVRKHLEHVYARLGVTNRVAVLAAYPELLTESQADSREFATV